MIAPEIPAYYSRDLMERSLMLNFPNIKRDYSLHAAFDAQKKDDTGRLEDLCKIDEI